MSPVCLEKIMIWSQTIPLPIHPGVPLNEFKEKSKFHPREQQQFKTGESKQRGGNYSAL